MRTNKLVPFPYENVLTCPGCGNQFLRTYGNRPTRVKFCSDACKQRAYRDRKKLGLK